MAKLYAVVGHFEGLEMVGMTSCGFHVEADGVELL
jgi:hypothetical protein